MKNKIIDLVRINRISTTEVADCLGKMGSMAGIIPVNSRHHIVGSVHWVYAYRNSNWTVHEQIQEVPTGSVVFISAIECDERAIIGDIVAKYLCLYKQAAGIVVDAPVRDVPRLIKEDWPVWSRGVNPVGCWNTDPESRPSSTVLKQFRDAFEDAIAVCDDTGVVIIPREMQTDTLMRALVEIEKTEDAWYRAIDSLKLNTFETICLRKFEQFD